MKYFKNILTLIIIIIAINCSDDNFKMLTYDTNAKQIDLKNNQKIQLPVKNNTNKSVTVIDDDNDGLPDGIDIDNNGKIDYKFYKFGDKEDIYGIDLNNDGKPDCFLFEDNNEIVLKLNTNGTGSNYELIVDDKGNIIGIVPKSSNEINIIKIKEILTIDGQNIKVKFTEQLDYYTVSDIQNYYFTDENTNEQTENEVLSIKKIELDMINTTTITVETSNQIADKIYYFNVIQITTKQGAIFYNVSRSIFKGKDGEAAEIIDCNIVKGSTYPKRYFCSKRDKEWEKYSEVEKKSIRNDNDLCELLCPCTNDQKKYDDTSKDLSYNIPFIVTIKDSSGIKKWEVYIDYDLYLDGKTAKNDCCNENKNSCCIKDEIIVGIPWNYIPSGIHIISIKLWDVMGNSSINEYLINIINTDKCCGVYANNEIYCPDNKNCCKNPELDECNFQNSDNSENKCEDIILSEFDDDYCNTKPIFKWSLDNPSSKTYSLRISSTGHNFVTTVFEMNNIKSTYLDYSNYSSLTPGDYWWSVRNDNTSGCEWSKVDYFKINANPSPSSPELISPNNNAIITGLTSSFSWNKSNVGNPDHYIFQIANDIFFSTIKYETTITDANSIVNFTTMPNLPSTGIYYWRIKSCAANCVSDCTSDWTLVRKITFQ